jgi:putative hydrolase of the HAD superfamily
MTIQAVFFDMGGTIETFYYDAALRLKASEELARLLKQKDLDLALSPGQLFLHIDANLNHAQQAAKETDEEISPECFWRDYVFCGTSFGSEQIEAAAEELSCWLETHYYLRRLRPEVPAVLEKLNVMGLKLGVISNIQSRTQVDKSLKKYGIRHYFEIVVTSSNYGVRKPHPSIFHYAASQMGIPTSACAHVGDRISRDIAGARRAGFGLAVQIANDFNPDQDTGNFAPDACITRMTELIEVIHHVHKESIHQDMQSRTIKAILFDAGDVLYYRNKKGQQFKAYLESLGLRAEENSNEYVESLEYQGYVGKISQDEYRQKLLDHYGVHGKDQIARGMKALAADDNNVLIFEGVRETLIALKNEGYLLGIITDTANPLRAKLDWFERAGFGHVWDAIVSSIDIGVRKPDPAIYQAAMRQLGIKPSQAVFIGHKASELSGARGVGMKTVAFNYETEAEADIYIEKFDELLQVPLLARKTSGSGISG